MSGAVMGSHPPVTAQRVTSMSHVSGIQKVSKREIMALLL
jgi:hypothetical protein